MPFMSKEELIDEAHRLNIDLEGLTWPQQQKAILDAQAIEKAELLSATTQLADQYQQHVVVDTFKKEGDRKVTLDREEYERLMLLAESAERTERENSSEHQPEILPEEISSEPVEEEKPDLMAPMRGKEVLISPEMAPTNVQLFGYDEELGDELDVEEVHHDVRDAINYTRDMVTGTYKVLGSTGRKVTAHTALPKEGAGITYRPDRDIVPIVTWQKRKGYLWTHQRLPNIKDLLKQSGYYEEYKDQFRDEPNVWHAAGKLLCCDISLTDHILEEIQRKAKTEKVEHARQQEFLSK